MATKTRRLKTTGVHAGKTVQLGYLQFLGGVVEWECSDQDFEGILKYHNRSFGVIEDDGSGQDNVHEQERPVQEGQGEVQAEGRPAEEEAVHVAEHAQTEEGSEGIRSDRDGQKSADPPKLKLAIDSLDRSNDDHWTAEGLPRVDIVDQRYEYGNVTRADIEVIGVTRFSK